MTSREAIASKKNQTFPIRSISYSSTHLWLPLNFLTAKLNVMMSTDSDSMVQLIPGIVKSY